MRIAIVKARHGSIRCQQRGIPLFIVDLLWLFGESQHHEGRDILSLTKKSVRRVAQYAGPDIIRQIQKYLSCYAVFENGACITVAYQSRHKKRDRQNVC